MEATVNINDVKQFVNSPKFSKFLINNTTKFETACFVLQTLLDKIEEIENGEKNNGAI